MYRAEGELWAFWTWGFKASELAVHMCKVRYTTDPATPERQKLHRPSHLCSGIGIARIKHTTAIFLFLSKSWPQALFCTDSHGRTNRYVQRHCGSNTFSSIARQGPCAIWLPLLPAPLPLEPREKMCVHKAASCSQFKLSLAESYREHHGLRFYQLSLAGSVAPAANSKVWH